MTNLFVGMQPILLISHSLPTKPSEVQTILNGLGYSTVEAIFKSIKLEWFIRISAGSFLPQRSMPVWVYVKLVAFKSEDERSFKSVLNRIEGLLGGNFLDDGCSSTSS